MRQLLIFSALLLWITGFSQSKSLHLRIGTGLFNFTGSGTYKEQILTRYQTIDGGAYGQAYGKKPGVSVSVDLLAKRAFKSKLLIGTALELQSFSARSKIVSVYYPSSSSMPNIVPAENGKAVYRGNFIGLAPFIGRRFNTKHCSIDAYVGPEVAFIISERNTMSYDQPDNGFKYKAEPASNHVDFRLDAGIDLQCKRTMFSLSYAYGLRNYYGQYIGGPQPESFSRMLRIGIARRL
jgi:hypothetical protein